MEDGPEKEERVRQLIAEGAFGAQRMFVGCLGGEPVVTMHDGKGRPRLRMRVDDHDVPRIEMLDEAAQVVSAWSPGESPGPQGAVQAELDELRRHVERLEKRIDELTSPRAV